MPAFIDLTGKQFGRLTVIEKAEWKKNGKIVWVCQCSCGKVIEIPGEYLSCGDTRSCGCYNSEAVSKRCRIDLVGRKFGKLTVLGFDYADKHKQLHWVCQCECGTTKSVLGNCLKNGNTISCGCVNRAIHSKRMTDMHYKHGLSYTKAYINAINKKRKETRRNLDSGWTTQMEIELYEMFPVCVVCGSREKLGVDHVKPLSKGHPLVPGNATVLCGKCNSKKFNRMPETLPDYMRIPILSSAAEFKRHWDALTLAA